MAEQDGSYLSRSWQTGDGMPSNVVTGIARDDDGFLWIGTGAGVARFDGVRFELFSIEQGLPDTQVLVLHLDRQGRIWAGTRRGAAYYENGVWQVLAAVPDKEIFSIGESEDGSIWFGAYNACWRWSNGHLAEIDLGGIPADTRSFLDDGHGGVWILTRGHLCHWSPDNPGVARPKEGPWIGYDLRDLARDPAGRIVICGTGLLLRENGSDWDNLGKAMPVGTHSPNLSCVADPGGGLWVATRDHGVLKLDGTDWTTIDSTNGLLSLDDARCLFIDDEGFTWVGTNGGGLNLLRPRLFEIYSVKEGLGRTVTSALVINGDGEVWVGNDGGDILKRRGDRFVSAFNQRFLPDDGSIWSLLAARDGSLWAGTYRDGLLVFASGARTPTVVPVDESLRSTAISSLYETRDDGILIGTQTAGARRWDGNRIDPDFDGPHGENLPVYDILEDYNGDVWAACGSHGLWRRRDGIWSRIGEEPGQSVPNPAALEEGENGEIWIGLWGQGLARYHNEQMTRWTKDNGLISDIVVQILEDDDRNLWLGTDAGLQQIAREDLDADDGRRFTGVKLMREDGLPTPQFSGGHGNLCARAEDGTLWFSLAAGVIHLDPRKVSRSASAPTVQIESATTDIGLVWERAGKLNQAEIVVEPGAGTLRIRFAAPDFVAPERLRFRCRMDGLEQEWQEVEGSRVVSYASLPPGNYHFQLDVAGRDGMWSFQPVGIDVVAKPFLWQTTGFRVLAAALMLTGIFLVIRASYSRRMRLHLVEVEQERRVDRERARIARDLHDDLGASLSEINFLGTLAGGTMAEGPPKEKVAGMVDRARQMAKSLDEIVWTVNPANDSLASTTHYLCSRVPESLSSAGIRCRLEVDDNLPDWVLTSGQRHELLMAVNEAVNNAMKHSGATELRLAIRFRESCLRVEIADSGRGFDPEKVARFRNGLKNMRDRMRSVGGTCHLDSGAGGTVVLLELPLSPPNNSKR